MRKIRSIIILVTATVLSSCKPRTMDECLAAAAKDAKSNAALEILKGVCEREHAEERIVIKNLGTADKILLTPPLDFLLGGVHSFLLTRSTMERTEFGIKAAVRDLEPPTERPEIRPVFDPDARYRSTPESQLEIVGIKEFDCKNRRTRWINSDTKLYIGSRGEPEAVLDFYLPEHKSEFQNVLREWSYMTFGKITADFEYVCDGKLNPKIAKELGYGKICGNNFDSSCSEK